MAFDKAALSGRGAVMASALLATLVSGGAVEAQEQPAATPADTQAPIAEPAQPAPTQAKPVSQPQSGSAEQPQVRSVRFDDWYYRCVDATDANGPDAASCEVAQISQVKQNGEGVNVLTLAIAKTASDTAGKDSKQVPGLLLTALVPLNVFLPAGFDLKADGKPVVAVNYRNCNQAGCWVQHKLDTKMLGTLQKGTIGEGSLRLMNGQNISIRFSLKGLTAALAELQMPAGPK